MSHLREITSGRRPREDADRRCLPSPSPSVYVWVRGSWIRSAIIINGGITLDSNNVNRFCPSAEFSRCQDLSVSPAPVKCRAVWADQMGWLNERWRTLVATEWTSSIHCNILTLGKYHVKLNFYFRKIHMVTWMVEFLSCSSKKL